MADKSDNLDKKVESGVNLHKAIACDGEMPGGMSGMSGMGKGGMKGGMSKPPMKPKADEGPY